MRYVTGIQVEEVIAHILNPRDRQGLELSETLIPLNDNEVLADYFAGHVQNSIKDPMARSANFVYLAGDGACSVCSDLLAGRASLVEGSQKLARRLYDIIARDERISPCDLAVCYYRAERNGEVGRYLAILKIDPTKVMRHKMDRDSQGKRYVNYEIDVEALPTSRERLQKCGFIRPMEPCSEYHMLVLDRQIGPTQDRTVARFFIDDFLGADLALDPLNRTKRLYKSLVDAENELRPQLTKTESQDLHKTIEYALTSQTVNVDNLIDGLNLRPEHKQRVDEIVSQRLPDREFEIDTQAGHRFVRRVRFRGDHSLRVEMDAEALSRIVEDVTHVENPGSPPYYRVTLRTERWEEVTS